MYSFYLKAFLVVYACSFSFPPIQCGEFSEIEDDEELYSEPEPLAQKDYDNQQRTEVEKHVGCILYRRIPSEDKEELQFLLLQPSKRRFRWIPPKGLGQFDQGENEETAALNKLEAKTGLTKDDVKVVPGFVKYTQFRVDGILKTTAYILAELINPHQELRRLSRYYLDFKWTPIDEACSLAMFGDLCEVLTSSYEYLKQYKHKA